MTAARALPLLIALAAGGGGGAAPAPASAAAEAAPAGAAAGWRRLALPDDRARLRDWRTTWIAAVAAARSGGDDGRGDGGAAAIAADPVLFDPDRALPDAAPPAGDYRCRTLKLGSRSATGLRYVAYGGFSCRIAVRDGRIDFVKATGSQRPVGRLYPDGSARLVFLGTLLLGDETRPLAYGRDASRDMIGVLTRIGPQRWRLALPAPRFESQLDLIELVPAG